MSPVAHALLEHHEQLQELARQADKLPLLDANRSELRDLLQREFQPDMERPGGRLWLDAVIDDIARIVLGGATRELADGIRGAALDVDVEKATTHAALERHVHCLDCAVDTVALGEYYMVRDEVWEQAAGDDGMLCIGCLEKRLGRRLEPRDFLDIPMNREAFASPRLRARVLGIEEAPAA
jgi:hypothetical protein